MGQWVDDIVRPLNSSGIAWLDTFAAQIMASYPATDPTIAPLIKEYNSSVWADESNSLAESFVYTAPEAPTPLPDAYIAQGQTMCLRQIAIGGYRLADLIEYIFTSTQWGKEAISQLREKERSAAMAAAP